eukprot:2060683-Pyramimonas_sp.AAC.1
MFEVNCRPGINPRCAADVELCTTGEKATLKMAEITFMSVLRSPSVRTVSGACWHLWHHRHLLDSHWEEKLEERRRTVQINVA